MKFFQATAPAGPVNADTAEARQTAAYQQGRADARKDVNERGLLQDRDTAVRRAYDRGRRDERAARHPRRRGSAVLTTFLVLVAAAGAFVVYLGVSQGSFSRGGQVVDQNLAGATSTASGAVHRTVDKAGDALENAGQSLKQTAGSNSAS
ncbi:MAG TPA: hypothetical protein VHW60_09905 [Caulobacteraceae bacterium]|nr:hypothetical protein [Caulobacteraceae bacterium]